MGFPDPSVSGPQGHKQETSKEHNFPSYVGII